MEPVKAKTKDLPKIKKELMEKQRYVCPLTGRDLRSISPANVVVDHCHTSGFIRAALTRGANGAEGKIKAILGRYVGILGTDVVQQAKFLHALADYILLHRTPQTIYIHPKHLSPAEQRAKRNATARKRYAAKKRAGG